MNEWINKSRKGMTRQLWEHPDLPICVPVSIGLQRVGHSKQLSTLTCTKWGMSSRVQAPHPLPQASTLVYKPCPVFACALCHPLLQTLVTWWMPPHLSLTSLFSFSVVHTALKAEPDHVLLFVACLHLHDNVSSWKGEVKAFMSLNCSVFSCTQEDLQMNEWMYQWMDALGKPTYFNLWPRLKNRRPCGYREYRCEAGKLGTGPTLPPAYWLVLGKSLPISEPRYLLDLDNDQCLLTSGS